MLLWGVLVLTDSERLYFLVVQYGLAKDSEYESKIKNLQTMICMQRVTLSDMLQYIMLRAERTAFDSCYTDILKIIGKERI